MTGVDPVDFLVRALKYALCSCSIPSYAKEIAVGRAVLEEHRLFFSYLAFFDAIFGCYEEYIDSSEADEAVVNVWSGSRVHFLGRG